MKIVCNKKLLTAAVMNVCRAIPVKSTVPVLEGMYITADNGEVILSGYDMELGITTKIKATVYQKGSIVINAKLFSEIVRKMPHEDITISVDEKNIVIISSGITQFSISGFESSQYPSMPDLEEREQINISSGKLKNMILHTLFAIALNDSKPVHMGSLIECTDNMIVMVSVDGIRLALKREKIESGINRSFVVPGKTLSEISKLINEDDSCVKIMMSDKHVVFDIGEYKVISRLLEGDFLDYKAAIPKASTTEVIISTKLLIDSIERTSLIVFDKLKAPIKLTLEENVIKMNCQSTTGNSYDEIECKIEGDLFEIGFNSKMLIDALKVIEEEEVKILMGGPLSPMKIVPVEGDDFIFLVLPVRLVNDEKETKNSY